MNVIAIGVGMNVDRSMVRLWPVIRVTGKVLVLVM